MKTMKNCTKETNSENLREFKDFRKYLPLFRETMRKSENRRFLENFNEFF